VQSHFTTVAAYFGHSVKVLLQLLEEGSCAARKPGNDCRHNPFLLLNKGSQANEWDSMVDDSSPGRSAVTAESPPALFVYIALYSFDTSYSIMIAFLIYPEPV